MEVKPFKRYSIPVYPQKQMIIDNPELLKVMPRRWQGNATLCAALSSALLLTLTACGQKDAAVNTPIEQKNTVVSSPAEHTSPPVNTVKVKGQIIAPVFVHGDGRGTFGCVSVAPPAFLSEEEAFQVIREEAARQGIRLEKGGPELENKILRDFTPDRSDLEKKNEFHSGKLGVEKLDGYDRNSGIAYEFLSGEDCYRVPGAHTGGMIEDYNLQAGAKTLGKGFEMGEGNLAVGMFYDPMTSYVEKGFPKKGRKFFGTKASAGSKRRKK